MAGLYTVPQTYSMCLCFLVGLTDYRVKLFDGARANPGGSGKAKGPMDETIHGTKTGQNQTDWATCGVQSASVVVDSDFYRSASLMRVYSPQCADESSLVNVPVRIGTGMQHVRARKFHPSRYTARRTVGAVLSKRSRTCFICMSPISRISGRAKLTDFTLNAYTEG